MLQLSLSEGPSHLCYNIHNLNISSYSGFLVPLLSCFSSSWNTWVVSQLLGTIDHLIRARVGDHTPRPSHVISWTIHQSDHTSLPGSRHSSCVSCHGHCGEVMAGNGCNQEGWLIILISPLLSSMDFTFAPFMQNISHSCGNTCLFAVTWAIKDCYDNTAMVEGIQRCSVCDLVLQCQDTLGWDKVGSQRLDPKLDTEAQLHGSPFSSHITVLQSKGGFGVIEIGHQM